MSRACDAGRKILTPPSALLVLLFLAGCRLGDPGPMFLDADTLQAQVARIKEAIGGKVRVLRVEIASAELTIRAQDPANRSHVNEWRAARMSLAGFTWERLSGPSPVRLDLINRDLEANLFGLDEIDFAAAPKLARAAIDRVGLEDAAHVTGMEIVRPVAILPEPSSGAPRWSVRVSSDHERATAFAALKGDIYAVDLAETNRAKNLDLFARPALAADAARDFRGMVGAGQVLTKVSISARSVGFETTLADKNHPIQPTESLAAQQAYSWDLSGLRRTLGSIAIVDAALNRTAPFAVDDVDWTVLPMLMTAAKDKLGMADGRVTGAEITRPTTGVGAAVVLWHIEVTDRNREKGTVDADVKGAIKQVTLPESRRPPLDYYDPATMVAALARIGEEFGAAAKFSEISFMGDKVIITAQDPRQPGEFAQILLTQTGFTRFGTPSMFAMAHKPFTLAELQPLTAQKLAALESATLSRLTMPPKAISNITVSRGSMDPSPRGNVTIEIRAEERPFGRGGRVNYELDGTVLKAYLP
jgi:hypothetical protein